MLANVPQFVDIEDKIAGPLTWKQLLWMIAMGIVLLVLWSMLTLGAFIAWATPIAVLFVALAFWRPYNQPLTKTIYHGVIFLFSPKMYVWQQEAQHIPKAETPKRPPEPAEALSVEDIRRAAARLDHPDETFLKEKKDGMI